MTHSTRTDIDDSYDVKTDIQADIADIADMQLQPQRAHVQLVI